MEPTELIFCKKCNEQAKKIVVVLESEMDMVWNEKEQIYEISEYYHNYENTKSVRCSFCINDLLENNK